MNCCQECDSNENLQFANKILNELHQAVPKIAEILNCHVSEVKLLDSWAFPLGHFSTHYADHPVSAHGLTNELPFLQSDRFHSLKGPPGYGLVLYECRGLPGYRYVAYSTKDNSGWRSTYYACRKGQLHRVIRNCRRLEKLANQNVPPILAGGLLEEVIKSSIHFLLHSKQIEKYGVRIKRGILLDGPPGNGKTMACRYIQKLCTDNDINWGVVSASDIDKAFNENHLDQLFNRYTVTFFDDIDISYLSRKAGNGKMACSILSSMDGICDSGHTVRIFTTNEKIDDLDPAFIRPGRIDRRFLFEKPDTELRNKLINSWPEEIVKNIDIGYLIRETNENSFAELEAIRANLVTNYLFGDRTWNAKKALKEFREGCGSFTAKPLKSSVGFASPTPVVTNGQSAAVFGKF